MWNYVGKYFRNTLSNVLQTGKDKRQTTRQKDHRRLKLIKKKKTETGKRMFNY